PERSMGPMASNGRCSSQPGGPAAARGIRTENSRSAMSRPKFLADHDLNEHIVAGIIRRAPSADFSRVREIGLHDRPDAEVLEYAVARGFIVVSHDVNTMPAAAYERLAAGKPIAGLLMVQQTSSIGLIIENLLLIWSASEAEEWENQVCFLPFE